MERLEEVIAEIVRMEEAGKKPDRIVLREADYLAICEEFRGWPTVWPMRTSNTIMGVPIEWWP